MDPVSLTATILSTTRICLASGKSIYDLHDRFRHASTTITAIYSESLVVGASLQRIQQIVQQQTQGDTDLTRLAELNDIFEAALVGCTLAYSSLDREIEALKKGTGEDGQVNRWVRARYIWKEDVMKELLQSIRAQNAALTLLLQCLTLENGCRLESQLQTLRDMMTDVHTNVVADAHPPLYPQQQDSSQEPEHAQPPLLARGSVKQVNLSSTQVPNTSETGKSSFPGIEQRNQSISSTGVPCTVRNGGVTTEPTSSTVPRVFDSFSTPSFTQLHDKSQANIDEKPVTPVYGSYRSRKPLTLAVIENFCDIQERGVVSGRGHDPFRDKKPWFDEGRVL